MEAGKFLDLVLQILPPLNEMGKIRYFGFFFLGEISGEKHNPNFEF